MGDTDATLATTVTEATKPAVIAENTVITSTIPDTSETGTITELKTDVKTEEEQKNDSVVRLPLKQAVELEMSRLDEAVENIDADVTFMHEIVDRRKEYLIELLQKLKRNRGITHNIICIHT